MRNFLAIFCLFLATLPPLAAQNDSLAIYLQQAEEVRMAGNYPQAASILTRVYEMVESDPAQKETKARVSMSIGIIYFFMKDYDSALLYYEKAMAGAEEIGNVNGQSIACINIGNIYQMRLDYDRARELYLRCIALHENDGDPEIIGSATYNLATCDAEQGLEDEAYEGFRKASGLAAQAGDLETEALALQQMAIYEAAHSMHAKADADIARSIEIAQNEGMLQVLHKGRQVSAEIYKAAGNWKAAYEKSRKVMELADTLFKLESMEQLNEFQVRYDTREKEAQIEIQNAVIRHERKIRLLAILAAILCGLSAIMFYMVLIGERRRRRDLEEIDAVKNKFFSIISHDLKNPVIAQHNVLKLMDENFDSIPADMLRLECSELHKSSETLKGLLENLLSWSRLQAGKMVAEPVRMDLNAVVRDVQKILQEQLKAKDISFESRIPENCSAFGDLNMISTVIRNIASNSVKFTPKGGHISVVAEPDGDVWRMTVEDDGVGMSEDTVASLFSLAKVSSTRGTEGESGSGLGLIICKEMVQKNGGRISVRSKPGRGTAISFTVAMAPTGK